MLTDIKAAGIVFEGGEALSGWALFSALALVIGVFSGFTGIILNALMKRKS